MFIRNNSEFLLFLCGVIGIVLYLLEIIYFRIALKFNIIDTPNIRSSHSDMVIRGGGIIFPIGIIIYCILFDLKYPFFTIGLLIVSSISLWDDIRTLPYKIRLFSQLIAVSLLLYDIGILEVTNWWIVGLTIIIAIGILNAFNFMDGINGITGSYSITVLLTLIIINNKIYFIDMLYLYFAIISLIVFNFFNLRKQAKCFAGDIGSIGIAFIIIFAIGKLIFQTNDITYIGLLVVYGVDTVMTLLHRIILRENLGIAHRKHLYQLLVNELKIPHLYVSILYAILQLFISIGIIYFPINNWVYFLLTTLFLCTIYVIFIKKYYHLHISYLQSKNDAV